MDIINLILKIIIGFFYAILIMKLSGKANLAPVSSYDQINNYILGGIVGGILFNKNITYFEMFYVLTIWGIISIGINYLRKKSIYFKRLIDGENVTVINNGLIIRKGIETAKITVSDLYLKLRLQGVFDIQNVDLASIEQNGQLIVLTKSDELPKVLVSDKVIDYRELEVTNRDEAWLNDLLEKNECSLDDIASIEEYKGNIRINLFR